MNDPKILFLSCLDFVLDMSDHCQDCHADMVNATGQTKVLYRPMDQSKIRRRNTKHIHIVGVFCCDMIEQAMAAALHDRSGIIQVWADVARRTRRQQMRPS